MLRRLGVGVRSTAVQAPRYRTSTVYGPFFRRWNERTQDREVIRAILTTGELWGRAPRGSDIPAVKAYFGELPADALGFEFFSVAPPDRPWGGVAYWRARSDGSVIVEDDLAKVVVLISRVDQEL
jgi:hypothetical protein